MSNLMKISFEQGGVKTTVLVRSNDTNILQLSDNYKLSEHTSLDTTLKILGLERVPLKEIIPKYKKLKNEDELTDNVCSICMNEIKQNEFIRELICKHTFHKKCVDKWIYNTPNCPYCRSNIYELKN